MRSELAWLLALCGCGGVGSSNPCVGYEGAVEDCHEEAMEALEGDLGNSWYGAAIDCPDEEDLSEDDVAFYTCVADAWEGADCTTTAGMLQAAVAATDCGIE